MARPQEGSRLSRADRRVLDSLQVGGTVGDQRAICGAAHEAHLVVERRRRACRDWAKPHAPVKTAMHDRRPWTKGRALGTAFARRVTQDRREGTSGRVALPR